MIQKQSYQITGMKQDNLVGTGFSKNFAHEIMNMRLNTIGDYTTAAWTTEKGTKAITTIYKDTNDYIWFDDININLEDLQPIGQANINDVWVLFLTDTSYPISETTDDNNSLLKDYIVRLRYNNNDLAGNILFRGNLKFDYKHPIETTTFYENEMLQKVYWLDGKNQPRVVNIASKDIQTGINTQFDFTQEVSLNETVEIIKDQTGAGLFPPCTVKYAITYYKKYGQETNVVYDSPLYYPTLGERACSPDELSGDSFYIKVTNLDLTHGFDYIRLYSIVKTTNNATPIVRIVADKPLPVNGNSNSEIIFHDTNTTGEIIDPTIIQYIGGKEIIAHTLDQKDNTLFLGNISLATKSVTKILGNTEINNLRANAQNITGENATFTFDNNVRETLGIRKTSNDWSVYQWVNQLNQSEVWNHGSQTYIKRSASSQYIKHFKFGETYRFGIQFQNNKGSWSEVVYLNDLENNTKPYTEEWNMECLFAGAKYVIPRSVVNVLAQNNYKKARLVCCYPTNTDRSIIAQGVIAPTVYNNDWRASHSPDVMSSWFFRPNEQRKTTSSDTFNRTTLPWDDDQPLDETYYTRDHTFKTIPEIQSTYHANGTSDEKKGTIWANDKSVYKVSRKIMTFHSPEIELDETLRTMPSEEWEVYVVGKVPINSYAAKYYLEAGAMAYTYSNDKGNGFSREFESQYVRTSENDNVYGSHFPSLGEWDDMNLYTTEGKQKEFLPYCIFPFQRKGSLNNYVKDINNWKVNKYWSHSGTDTVNIKSSSVLQTKVLSHILYSTTALYEDETRALLLNSDNATFNIFDTNEVLPLKLKTSGEDFIYYGNVNSISPISDNSVDSFLNGYQDSNEYPVSGAYPIPYYQTRTNGTIKYNFGGVNESNKSSTLQGVYVSDPVPITYKSTPHGVFFTNRMFEVDNNMPVRDIRVPGSIGGIGTIGLTTGDSIRTAPTTRMPFLHLAEIRRKVDSTTRFGGTPTDDNPINNIYVPCGKPVNISYVQNGADVNVYGLEGDTYYMRYDNLKTYPFSTEDTNQIVEILSFMVETRINLDGRYDKNRGLLDNTMITKSYTQDNNTFTFLTLDQMSAELNDFANQLTWTNTKVSGEDVDAWTNITLASTADANGTLGAITKILNLNDKLYLFQDHGIAQIGFNESTAISTESGVPLELAKTGKYTGLNYLSTEIGCQNKWSISSTKNGVFFIDDSRQELLTLSEGFTSLSSAHGFDAFMIQQLPSIFKTWNPVDFDNFVTYYDKLSNDVYYINKNVCLTWNEQSKTFTSFYNYENTPYMMNLGSHSLMWHNGVYAARELDSYSNFFGETKPYWMTIVCDGQTDNGSAFPADKVFNNIEYRADTFNPDGVNSLINEPIFNKKAAWNGYQKYWEFPIDAERRFNIWRVQLPRATYDIVNGQRVPTRDRIRNPFCYIKLLNDDISSPNRKILHDLAVYFDMK